MKKTIAVFFLVIFLFNVGGYHLLFWSLRVQAKKDLLHRLDASAYSSDDVVVLTLPVSIPYPIHDAAFEPASGELEYQGVFYQLVKQKIENDTLFMVCVKDHNQAALQQTMNEFTNLTQNLPANTKHTMDLLSKLYKDFTPSATSMMEIELVLKYDILFAVGHFSIIQQVLPVDSPPPELS